MGIASSVAGNDMPGIIYENADVLVIDKPSGLIVHGDGRTEEPTLADWLIARDPAIASVGEPWTNPRGEMIPRPGIVHRLDRETSGVMIVAKTQEAFAHLKKQFQERLARKEYAAFVYGHPKEERGMIDKPIGRSPADFRRWSAQPGARGALREARTEWRTLRRGTDPDTNEPVSLLAASPLSGRTHQIRVHLKAIHHPVICDRLYAEGKPCLLGFGRTALHAHRLAITLPDGTEHAFEAPFPDDFAEAIAKIA